MAEAEGDGSLRVAGVGGGFKMLKAVGVEISSLRGTICKPPV